MNKRSQDASWIRSKNTHLGGSLGLVVLVCQQPRVQRWSFYHLIKILLWAKALNTGEISSFPWMEKTRGTHLFLWADPLRARGTWIQLWAPCATGDVGHSGDCEGECLQGCKTAVEERAKSLFCARWEEERQGAGEQLGAHGGHIPDSCPSIC